MRIKLTIILIFCVLIGNSQAFKPTLYPNVKWGKNIYILNGSSDSLPPSYVLVNIKRGSCKLVRYIFRDTIITSPVKAVVIRDTTAKVVNTPINNKNLLSIHGNVLYDYFYQSHIDTPYSVNGIQQHTITTFLDIKIKDEYPLRVYFTTRLGNTNYLRNITNLNFQYTPQTFINTAKDRIKSYARQKIDSIDLDQYDDLLESKVKNLQALKKWINDPSVLQRLVEEKEAAYMKKYRAENLPKIKSPDTAFSPVSEGIKTWLVQKLQKVKNYDSTKSKDSSQTNISQEYAEQKQKIDSLEKEIATLRSKIRLVNDSVNKEKTKLNYAINNLRNQQDIKSAIEKNNIPDSILPKGYKTLLAIQKLNIGTSVASYSELSVKDVTISGLQVEYNPKLYYGVAAGYINYRFRDYLLPDRPGPKQYLGLIRFGKQSKDSSSLIFTYYYGRKMLYNYYTTDSIYQQAAPTPNFNLMGFTIEKKIRLNRHSFLIAEVAKSSLPYYHVATQDKQFSSVLTFSDHSNEAYSLKINSFIPYTQTKLEGYFKHYGANFQSFTLISTSSAQNAFLLSVSQPFFKNQLRVNASIRKNDYVNPFIDQHFVSNTLFKSLQATLAMKRLPVISIGFYPVTQLMKLNNTTFSESLFYTLTTNASYLYNVKQLNMNTTLGWMRFYNKPTDSGFAYFNTNNFFINHSVFFPLLTIQTSLSYASNTNYSFLSFGENLQIKFTKWLLLGSGLKYNKQDIMFHPQIGYDINGTIKMGQLGSIQLRGEKAYLPGPDKQLISNNTGRITYYKSF